MGLENLRKDILKEIIELYQDTENYDMLMNSISNNENIAELLRANAVVYSILMASNRLVWNDNEASFEYSDSLVRYQKGYQLYEQYAYYFLGANIVHPSLDWQKDYLLVEYSLVSNEGLIDYQSFLDKDMLVRERKSA